MGAAGTPVNHRVLVMLLTVMASILSSPVAMSAIVKSLPGYPQDLPFKLETGYIGVGESEEIQLFYYFIESEGDPTQDPLVLWLTGGPGCSGFSGLSLEIGPIMFNFTDYNPELGSPNLVLNPFSWTKVASIIFVDSPAGTGFSYANTSEGYQSGDFLQSANIYEFLQKWLLERPEFLRHSVFVAGDSWSGKVVPIVLRDILNGNEMGKKPIINLTGYVLGNPVTDDLFDTNSKPIFEHRNSIISDECYESVQKDCNGDLVHVNTSNTKCVLALQERVRDTNPIYFPNILEPRCLYTSPRPNREPAARKFGARSLWCRDNTYRVLNAWANNEQVKDALHVRKGTVDYWVRCNNSLTYTRMSDSSIPFHLNLTTKSLRGLIYSGDQDRSIPYLATYGWIRSLNVPNLGYDNWRPWFVNGQVAGYVSSYIQPPFFLTYTTIKGAGHIAPEYKPRECFAMFQRWVGLRLL